MVSQRKHIRGWVVYPIYVSLKSDYAFDWLAEEAAVFNISLEAHFLEELGIVYGGKAGVCNIYSKNMLMDDLPDFVLMRGYDAVVSRFFEDRGVRVINTSESMSMSQNKMLTHQALVKSGLPTPHSIYTTDNAYSYAEISALLDSERFVVKTLEGSKGEGVYLIHNRTEFENIMRLCKSACMCQEFIESSRGRDVRVWVVGDSVAGSVLRYSETSFKSNYSQGGSAAPYELDEYSACLCVDACRALGLEFAGVDLLFDADGVFVICEINGNAGFRTMSATGSMNTIPHKLFEYIARLF